MRTKTILGILLLILMVLLSIKFFTTYLTSLPEKLPPTTENIQQEAEAFYQKLLKNKPKVSTKLQHLENQVNAKQAYDHKDWYSARSGFMRVLAENPQDTAAWIFLIKSLYQLKEHDAYGDYAQEYEYAKIKALELVPTTDKDLIQHLEFPQETNVKTQLQGLISTYPTEFSPYFLDIPQQAESGTACLSFTYPLLQNRDFHYEDYVQLTPKVADLGVRAHGNKLCLEGLSFGENYQLILKKGFAGKPNVKLDQGESLSLYIPHRKPSISFRERGYILPTLDQQIIPFMAVNVSQVKVRIFHIPERNIPSIQTHWFSNQLGRWEMDSLGDEYGELIWEGVYYCESEMNHTGISGFPIDKMIGKKLEPGVYVLETRISENSYDNHEFASQAFIVSHIGLSTYKGPDGLHVMTRDINTAQAMSGVQVALIAKNNRELAVAVSDANGMAHFTTAQINGLGGNAPAFLTASLKGQQFTVLNLRNEAFDLSDRGAQGRVNAGSLEAYVYTERGIYRPGETVHLMGLLRQTNGTAQTQLPLTLMIYRPDGVLVHSSLLQDKGLGGYQFDYAVNEAAPMGQWTAALYLDTQSEAIGKTTFEVHDFIPPRIEVKTQASLTSIVPHQNNPIEVRAQYYFGTPASNLRVEAESILTAAKPTFPQWADYQFGLEEESWAPLRFKHPETLTNENGQARIDVLIDAVPQTTQFLALTTQVTVFEVGGRGQHTKQIISYWHQPFALGIKSHFKDKTTTNHAKAAFELIAINQHGELLKQNNIRYTLYAEQQDFIWFRNGTQWQYELVTRDRMVNQGKTNLSENAPTLLEVPVEYGLYRLEIIDEKTGIASSLRFSAGWLASKENPDKPDMLDLKYEAGKVWVQSPFAGELVLALADQTFKPLYQGKIGKEGLSLDIAELAAYSEKGGYLIGTVFRPAEVKKAQMPTRAIGVAWLTNPQAQEKHRIDFTVQVPEQIKSNSQVNVKVNIPSRHKKMHISAALVDEATLSLIDYKSPDPFHFFFAQKTLSYELRDSYGFLINPFGAHPGSFEEGADSAETVFSPRALTKLPAKAYKVVSLFSGIIDAHEQDNATIVFSVPEFSGRLRLMVVAWDETGLGTIEKSIIVRDEVDVYFVLPRFLAPKDQTSLPLVLHNLAGKEGEYTIHLQAEKFDYKKTIYLKKNSELRLPVDLSFDSLGTKSIHFQLNGPDNFTLSRQWEITVRPKVQPIAQVRFGLIEPHQSYTLNRQALANFDPQTSEATFTVGSLPDFASAQLIKELENYPYLCLEQTTSRMLATLLDPKIDKPTLNTAFNQLSSLQKFDGSFGLWSSLGQTEPWLSLYVSDVMLMIHAKGIVVPQALTENLNRWIEEIRDNQPPALVSYASYLKAKQGKGTLGALSYYAKTHEAEIITKQDAAFIAAAFAYYGKADLASYWFDKAIAAKSLQQQSYSDSNGFRSDLQDNAVLVSLLAETTQQHPQLFALAHRLSAQAAEATYLSTQEKAWLIRASAQLQNIKKDYDLKINNQPLQGSATIQKHFNEATLKTPVLIANDGKNPVFYALSMEGVPSDLSQLKPQGFSIDRTIYTFEGQEVDPKQLVSGERYIVVIKGKRLKKDLRHVLLVDLLPAGFEIEEANLLKESLNAAFPWLDNLTPASRIESRDDRFVSAYEFDQQSNFVTAYLVRAVSKGTFTYPAVYVEAMYQPQNFSYGAEQIIKIK